MNFAVGDLISWAVEALLQFLMKEYWLLIRVYNHDSRAIKWVAASYAGDNATIHGEGGQVVEISALLLVGTRHYF